MLRRPTPSTSLLRRSSPSPSAASIRSLSHTTPHPVGRPWSYKPQLRPEGVAWKKDTPITFSHGFVRKELTPSPARQPPKVAPYGPGSGTHTDPQITIGPGAKSSDMPVISGASRYGPGRVIGGRRAEREEGRVSSPEASRALPAPEQTRSRFDPMNKFGGQMEGYGFKQPAAGEFIMWANRLHRLDGTCIGTAQLTTDRPLVLFPAQRTPRPTPRLSLSGSTSQASCQQPVRPHLA